MRQPRLFPEFSQQILCGTAGARRLTDKAEGKDRLVSFIY
jgi:hypothetical protein